MRCHLHRGTRVSRSMAFNDPPDTAGVAWGVRLLQKVGAEGFVRRARVPRGNRE
ncbi:hypothetical protein PA7559_37820 [Pseudoalteromonas distincta]